MENREEDCERLLYERIARLLSTRYHYWAPILLSFSMIVGLLSILAYGSMVDLLAATAVSLSFIGGFLEFYNLLILYKLKIMHTEAKESLLRAVGKAAFLVALFYILIGIYLIDKEYEETCEIVMEKPINDTPCSRYANKLLHVLTLGILSASFHYCVSSMLATWLSDHVIVDELPIGLGSEADDREQDSRCLNRLIYDQSPCSPAFLTNH